VAEGEAAAGLAQGGRHGALRLPRATLQSALAGDDILDFRLPILNLMSDRAHDQL
jgi:hypothetical protein